LKNFRSFLNNDKSVNIVALIAIFVLFAAAIIGFKFINNFNENNNLSENSIETEPAVKSDVKYSFYGWGCKITLPTKYLPFKCSSKESIYFHYYCRNYFQTGSWDLEDKFIYLKKSENSFLPLFETDTQLYICGYIDGALYLNSECCLYRVVVDEKGDIDYNSFSRIMDKKAAPVCVKENEMYLKVTGEPDDYYVLLNTLTGECKQADDFNEILPETSKTSLSKQDAERIAMHAVKQEISEEEMLLYSDCRESEKEYETVLIYQPDLSVFNINADESIEYCWKVELVANIPDWWMPSATLYINAKTGDVVYCNVIYPD